MEERRYNPPRWRFLDHISDRTMIVIVFFALTVVLALGMVVYQQSFRNAKEGLRQQLMLMAQVSSTVIDPEAHDRLLHGSTEQSPDYFTIVEPLRRIAEQDPRIESIYTLVRTADDQAIFVVDTAVAVDSNNDGTIDESEDKAHLGEPYDISEYTDLTHGFNFPSADTDITVDKWGAWLSGYAPILDASGHPIGMVGIDFRANEIEEQATTIILDFLPWFIFILLVACAVAIWLARWLSRPNVILAARVNEISEENECKRIEVIEHLPRRTSFEVLQVGRAIAHLVDRLCTIQDQLEHRVAERTSELNAANETLRSFIYYTAHQLRTPLNVVRWGLESLKTEELGRLNKRQHEMVEQIHYSTKAVIDVASELQDSLVIQRGGMVLHAQELHIEDVITEVIGEVAVEARQKQLSITWKRPKRSLPLICVDHSRVRQVLEVLLENSIRYTPQDGSITVRAVAVNGMIRVEVADTGIGIPKLEQKNIFRPFFRGTNARRVYTDGTGIGLALVKLVIEKHNGTIDFRTEEGVGTTFTFTLPVHT